MEDVVGILEQGEQSDEAILAALLVLCKRVPFHVFVKDHGREVNQLAARLSKSHFLHRVIARSEEQGEARAYKILGVNLLCVFLEYAKPEFVKRDYLDFLPHLIEHLRCLLKETQIPTLLEEEKKHNPLVLKDSLNDCLQCIVLIVSKLRENGNISSDEELCSYFEEFTFTDLCCEIIEKLHEVKSMRLVFGIFFAAPVYFCDGEGVKIIDQVVRELFSSSTTSNTAADYREEIKIGLLRWMGELEILPGSSPPPCLRELTLFCGTGVFQKNAPVHERIVMFEIMEVLISRVSREMEVDWWTLLPEGSAIPHHKTHVQLAKLVSVELTYFLTDLRFLGFSTNLSSPEKKQEQKQQRQQQGGDEKQRVHDAYAGSLVCLSLLRALLQHLQRKMQADSSEEDILGSFFLPGDLLISFRGALLEAFTTICDFVCNIFQPSFVKGDNISNEIHRLVGEMTSVLGLFALNETDPDTLQKCGFTRALPILLSSTNDPKGGSNATSENPSTYLITPLCLLLESQAREALLKDLLHVNSGRGVRNIIIGTEIALQEMSTSYSVNNLEDFSLSDEYLSISFRAIDSLKVLLFLLEDGKQLLTSLEGNEKCQWFQPLVGALSTSTVFLTGKMKHQTEEINQDRMSTALAGHSLGLLVVLLAMLNLSEKEEVPGLRQAIHRGSKIYKRLCQASWFEECEYSGVNDMLGEILPIINTLS